MAAANAGPSPWRPYRQSLVNTLDSISASFSQLTCVGVYGIRRRGDLGPPMFVAMLMWGLAQLALLRVAVRQIRRSL